MKTFRAALTALAVLVLPASALAQYPKAYPVGPAGGALIGTYPNPGIDAAALSGGIEAGANFSVFSSFDGGTSWTTGPGCADITDFGTVGTVDDGPVFQAALNATAGKGVAVCVPFATANGQVTNGVYTIATGIQAVSHATLTLAEGVTLLSAEVDGGITNGLIYYAATASGGTSTTLAANVGAVGPPVSTFTVTSATGFAIGDTAWFQSVDGFPQAYYGIINVVGTTITVDRPIVWPFLAGDSVTSIPSDPTLQYFTLLGLGAGATISGTGSHALFIIGDKHCIYKNIRCTPYNGGSTLNPGCFGEEVGWDSRWEDNFGVSTATFGAGKNFAWVSVEQAHVLRNTVVQPDLGGSTNFELYDLTGLDFEGNSGLGSNGACVLLGTETSDTGRPGVVDSHFVDTVCIGANLGIRLTNNSSRNSFTNTLVAANYYPAGQIGIYLDGGCSDNQFAGFSLWNSIDGLQGDAINTGNLRNKFSNGVLGGTIANYFRTVAIPAGNAGWQFSNVDAIEGYNGQASQILINSDATWDGFSGSFSSGNGFAVGAAHFSLSRATMALDATSAPTSGIITTSSSSTVDLDRVVCTLTNNATCVNNGGGVINLIQVTGSGTGTGLISAGGATSVNSLGLNTNLLGFSTPIAYTNGSVGTWLGSSQAAGPPLYALGPFTGSGGGTGEQSFTIPSSTTTGTVTLTAAQGSYPTVIFYPGNAPASVTLTGTLTVEFPIPPAGASPFPSSQSSWWSVDTSAVNFAGSANSVVLQPGGSDSNITLTGPAYVGKIIKIRIDSTGNDIFASAL
jgi:hypothetical protein